MTKDELLEMAWHLIEDASNRLQGYLWQQKAIDFKRAFAIHRNEDPHTINGQIYPCPRIVNVDTGEAYRYVRANIEKGWIERFVRDADDMIVQDATGKSMIERLENLDLMEVPRIGTDAVLEAVAQKCHEAFPDVSVFIQE